MIFEHLTVGAFQCNCFILGCEQTKQAIVIDPGDALDQIEKRVAAHGLTVTHIIATHAHLDHVGAMSGLGESTGAPTCMHADDQFLYDQLAMQAGAQLRMQVSVGFPHIQMARAGDEPNIDNGGRSLPGWADRPGGQGAGQGGLKRRGHPADFVEIEGAAMGLLQRAHDARPAVRRFGAEQGLLHPVRGDGRGVDDDERAAGAL